MASVAKWGGPRDELNWGTCARGACVGVRAGPKWNIFIIKN